MPEELVDILGAVDMAGNCKAIRQVMSHTSGRKPPAFCRQLTI